MKRWVLSGGMLSLLLFLSGCMRIDQETGQPAGGFSQLMYDYLVIPTQQFLEWMAQTTGSYGLAIIVLTIVIRVLILPLGMRQQRSMMEQQLKMSTIKPVTDEIQKEMKETEDPREKQELQAELMEVYRDNDMSMFGQLSGCLPMLIQMPIFIAMFHAIQNSESIAQATWLGISLGERSILLGVLTGAIYYIQTKLMHVGMPEEQRQQQGGAAMTLMTPVMMLFFSVTGPAGLALYWFAGGFVAIAQSLLTNLYYKPKMEAELKEKHGEQKLVERKRQPKKKEEKDTSVPTKAPSASEKRRNNSPFESKGRRNEGRQNYNR